MTARRCPNCGGLVTADVEWCNQCFTRLDRPPGGAAAAGGTRPTSNGAPPSETAGRPEGAAPQNPSEARPGSPSPDPAASPSEPPARQAGTAPQPATSARTDASGLRVGESGLVVWDCPACGRENELEAQACPRCGTPFGRLWEEPERPSRVSADRAMALSLVFPGAGHIAAGRVAEGAARAVVFAFTLGMVLAILTAGGGLGGPLVPLVVLFVGASVTLYMATVVDARRAVTREPPVLTTRMLLIGATALLVVAVVVLLIGGTGAL